MQGDAYVPFTREYLEAHGGRLSVSMSPPKGRGNALVVAKQ